MTANICCAPVLRRLVGIALVAMLGACATGPSAVPGAAATAVSPALGQQYYASAVEGPYRLHPNDEISVIVFREPDLTIESVTIAADGQFSMPLLGPVGAAGKSVQELEAELEGALGARYLRQPDVAVNVVKYGSHRVTVEGAVEEPGVYDFVPGDRLSAGIASAQGATRTANSGDIAIFRETPDGLMIAKFDYAAIRNGTMLDPVLQPGDRIVVGTNSLSQFWQDLLRALPAFALFTNVNF